MDLKQAQALAQEIVDVLAPHCSQIQIAGSIRRKKPFPRDVDIVLIPANQGALLVALQTMGRTTSGAGKLLRLTYRGVGVDIYVATPETWATLLLIRTGSKESNIRLCSVARSKGMKLHADGTGLFSLFGLSPGCEGRIAGDTEESIFAAFGLPYLEPERRV